MAGNHREMSSSPGLSTPPKSPESPSSGEAIVVDRPPVTYPILTKSPIQKSNTIKTARSQGAAAGDQSAPKQPRKRAIKSDKKKEDGDAPPKQRKPRAKKQKDEQETNSPSTSALKSASAQSTAASKSQPSKQPRINEVMNMAAPHTLQTKSSPTQSGPAIHGPSLIGNKLEGIQKPIKSEPIASTFINQTPQTQFSSTTTSRGQNYDPIRSSTIEVPRPTHTSNPGTPSQISPIKNPPGRASASPSIASLMNPQATQTYPTTTTASRPSSSSATTLHISPRQHDFVQQPQKSAGSVDSPRSVPVIPTPTVKPPTPPLQQLKALPTAMDIDSDAPAKASKSNNSRKPSVSTNNSSSAPSPKQAGTKSKNSTSTPNLPPLPGTGLLSGSSLFNGGPSNQPSASGQTIIIEVPLNGETNKYINFARLAEEKYGYNALHPKLAAQRDRLARVAAYGAVLESNSKNGTSADEMSLDASEGEGEQSNADKKASGTENGAPKKRKRQMKEDQYDKDDPFVDDTELAWEEQAAASKDGFFVYSGPLVTAGEKANIERYVHSMFTSYLLLIVTLARTALSLLQAGAVVVDVAAALVPVVDVALAEAAQEGAGVQAQQTTPMLLVTATNPNELVAVEQRGSLASPKPTAHAWRPKSLKESVWASMQEPILVLLAGRTLPPLRLPPPDHHQKWSYRSNHLRDRDLVLALSEGPHHRL